MDGCGHVAKPPWVSISLSVDWGFCWGAGSKDSTRTGPVPDPLTGRLPPLLHVRPGKENPTQNPPWLHLPKGALPSVAVKEEEQKEMTEKKTVPIGNREEYFLYPAGFSWNSECTLRNSFLLELGTWLLPYHAHLQNTWAFTWNGFPVNEPVLTPLHASSLCHH